MQVEFEAVCGPKFMTLQDNVGDPMQLSTHLAHCLLWCFVPNMQAVKVAVKLRSRPKRWFLSPRFVGGGDIPDFGHAFSNYTCFRPCGRFSLSSLQRPRRLGGEKMKKERKKKHWQNILCRRPNWLYNTMKLCESLGAALLETVALMLCGHQI